MLSENFQGAEGRELTAGRRTRGVEPDRDNEDSTSEVRESNPKRDGSEATDRGKRRTPGRQGGWTVVRWEGVLPCLGRPGSFCFYFVSVGYLAISTGTKCHGHTIE